LGTYQYTKPGSVILFSRESQLLHLLHPLFLQELLSQELLSLKNSLAKRRYWPCLCVIALNPEFCPEKILDAILSACLEPDRSLITLQF
jgi:hypothetical protein